MDAKRAEVDGDGVELWVNEHSANRLELSDGLYVHHHYIRETSSCQLIVPAPPPTVATWPVLAPCGVPPAWLTAISASPSSRSPIPLPSSCPDMSILKTWGSWWRARSRRRGASPRNSTRLPLTTASPWGTTACCIRCLRVT